ncbi:hypothetical protein EEB12_28950 [Rhodococcus sp. WS1]|nr:hypothetical protein EEB12_28950 [Rhodococcus sp. WS1]TQC35957.1 hypothetical protein EEB16_20560 [Rhodococcus sp. WS7]
MALHLPKPRSTKPAQKTVGLDGLNVSVSTAAISGIEKSKSGNVGIGTLCKFTAFAGYVGSDDSSHITGARSFGAPGPAGRSNGRLGVGAPNNRPVRAIRQPEVGWPFLERRTTQPMMESRSILGKIPEQVDYLFFR